jgi:hypothetical protein
VINEILSPLAKTSSLGTRMTACLVYELIPCLSVRLKIYHNLFSETWRFRIDEIESKKSICTANNNSRREDLFD